MYAHHKFNEHATVGLVADNIAQGRSAALISDAGTPGISDPGFLLVRACLEAGIEVETLPGATAFVPALVQSGFPCDRFCFEGFLPQKKGRNKHLQSLASEPRTMIFTSRLSGWSRPSNSSPRCSVRSGWRPCRGTDQKSEQTVRGTLAEVADYFREHTPKGEFVIVVAGLPKPGKNMDTESEEE